MDPYSPQHAMVIVFEAIAVVALLVSAAIARPELEIVQPEFDFGTVPANVTVVYRPWLKSTGDDTVKFESIKTGCGCLAAPDSLEDLAPGDSVQIALSWQTRAADGEMTSSVYVFSNAGPDPSVIKLSAAGGKGSLPIADLGRPGAIKGRFQFVLRNDAEFEIALRRVSPTVPAFEMVLPETIPAQSQATGNVTLSEARQDLAKGRPELATFEDSVTIEFLQDEQAVRRFTIPVRFGDFSFRPTFTTTKTNVTE